MIEARFRKLLCLKNKDLTFLLLRLTDALSSLPINK